MLESAEFRFENSLKTDQGLIIAGEYGARSPMIELLEGHKICIVNTLK